MASGRSTPVVSFNPFTTSCVSTTDKTMKVNSRFHPKLPLIPPNFSPNRSMSGKVADNCHKFDGKPEHVHYANYVCIDLHFENGENVPLPSCKYTAITSNTAT